MGRVKLLNQKKLPRIEDRGQTDRYIIRGIRRSSVAESRIDNTATTCDGPLRRCVNLPRRRLLRSFGLV